MRPALASRLGLWRSLLVYRAQVWRGRGLRRLYRSLLRPGDLAFDIGAHVGNRAQALAAAGARVVAVEPQPVFAAFLARRVASDRIRVAAVAVGSRPGTAVLNVSRLHPTVSTLSADWIDTVGGTAGFGRVAWDEKVEVPVTTLDALIAEHGRPAFCKIDVEGLESEVLAGLSQPLPLLAFEYLPAALGVAEACIDRLEALGRYRYNLVSGETARFRLSEWIDAAAMLARLRDLGPDDRSGDVYARLDAPGTA